MTATWCRNVFQSHFNWKMRHLFGHILHNHCPAASEYTAVPLSAQYTPEYTSSCSVKDTVERVVQLWLEIRMWVWTGKEEGNGSSLTFLYSVPSWWPPSVDVKPADCVFSPLRHVTKDYKAALNMRIRFNTCIPKRFLMSSLTALAGESTLVCSYKWVISVSVSH